MISSCLFCNFSVSHYSDVLSLFFIKRKSVQMIWLVVLTFGFVCCEGQSNNNTREFIIAAYLPDYRIDVLKINSPTSKLSDIILFSLEPSEDGRVLMQNRFSNDTLLMLKKDRAEFGIRVIICVGGGARSKWFSLMSRNQGLRQKFTASLLDTYKLFEADGIDLDWEGDLGVDKSKWEDFTLLIRDIRSKFREEKQNPIISIAAHVGQEQAITSSVLQLVDRVHLMAYDLCSSEPCQHSTLSEVESSLQIALKYIPASKIVLGLPAYGRAMKSLGDVLSYSELVFKFGPLSKAQDLAGGFYFNGRQTAKAKLDLAWDHGLAGVFVWEAGQDLPAPHSASLLYALNDQRRRRLGRTRGAKRVKSSEPRKETEL